MKRNDWDIWWAGLNQTDRRTVRAWLVDNPPPPYWQDGKVAYAFTEMSLAPRGKR